MTLYSCLNIDTGVDVAAPLRTLHHSHDAIVGQLGQLDELPALVVQMDRARQLAARALVLFRDEVLQHHADEEKALLPAVLDSAAPGDERHRVEVLAERLRTEHRSLERLWREVEPGLKAVARGQADRLHAAGVTRLVRLYSQHVAFEEAEFLPLAQDILGRNAHHLQALGSALHLRRVPAVSGHI